MGAPVGAVSIALYWNKRDVKEFSRLVGSSGIVAVVAANPALGILPVVALAKAFSEAKKQGDYRHFVDGLAKGGIGSGAFLATSSLVGGPVFVGILAGMCTDVVVHKALNRVEVSEITDYVQTSVSKAVEAVEVRLGR